MPLTAVARAEAVMPHSATTDSSMFTSMIACDTYGAHTGVNAGKGIPSFHARGGFGVGVLWRRDRTW